MGSYTGREDRSLTAGRHTADRKVAHRKSDQRRGDRCADEFVNGDPHTPLRYPPKGVGLRSNMGNCRQHCQSSKRKRLMKTRKSHILAKSTPTLTQSGLLAVLLQRQRHKVIELAERRAHRSQMRSAFSSALTWLFGRSFHRGVGGTLPRHP